VLPLADDPMAACPACEATRHAAYVPTPDAWLCALNANRPVEWFVE
jgi:hypothetical protein